MTDEAQRPEETPVPTASLEEAAAAAETAQPVAAAESAPPAELDERARCLAAFRMAGRAPREADRVNDRECSAFAELVSERGEPVDGLRGRFAEVFAGYHQRLMKEKPKADQEGND